MASPYYNLNTGALNPGPNNLFPSQNPSLAFQSSQNLTGSAGIAQRGAVTIDGVSGLPGGSNLSARDLRPSYAAVMGANTRNTGPPPHPSDVKTLEEAYVTAVMMEPHEVMIRPLIEAFEWMLKVLPYSNSENAMTVRWSRDKIKTGIMRITPAFAVPDQLVMERIYKEAHIMPWGIAMTMEAGFLTTKEGRDTALAKVAAIQRTIRETADVAIVFCLLDSVEHIQEWDEVSDQPLSMHEFEVAIQNEIQNFAAIQKDPSGALRMTSMAQNILLGRGVNETVDFILPGAAASYAANHPLFTNSALKNLKIANVNAMYMSRPMHGMNGRDPFMRPNVRGDFFTVNPGYKLKEQLNEVRGEWYSYYSGTRIIDSRTDGWKNIDIDACLRNALAIDPADLGVNSDGDPYRSIGEYLRYQGGSLHRRISIDPRVITWANPGGVAGQVGARLGSATVSAIDKSAINTLIDKIKPESVDLTSTEDEETIPMKRDIICSPAVAGALDGLEIGPVLAEQTNASDFANAHMRRLTGDGDSDGVRDFNWKMLNEFWWRFAVLDFGQVSDSIYNVDDLDEITDAVAASLTATESTNLVDAFIHVLVNRSEFVGLYDIQVRRHREEAARAETSGNDDGKTGSGEYSGTERQIKKQRTSKRVSYGSGPIRDERGHAIYEESSGGSGPSGGGSRGSSGSSSGGGGSGPLDGIPMKRIFEFAKFCAANDIPCPLQFLCFRSRIVEMTGVMIAAAKGVGKTFAGHAMHSESVNALQRSVTREYVAYMQPAVTKSQNLVHIHNVFVGGNIQGESVRFLDLSGSRESATQVEMYRHGRDVADIICVPVPLDWEPDRNFVDVTGKFNPFRVVDNDPDNSWQFPKEIAKKLARTLGIRHVSPDFLFDYLIAQKTTQNTLCFQTRQKFFNGHSGRFDDEVAHKGHWGPFYGESTLAFRTGKGGIHGMSGYKVDSN